MMAVFPSSIVPQTYTVSVQFRTVKIGTDGDFIQRRRKRDKPLASFTLGWNAISTANLKTLYDFYTARYGSYEAFAFFDFNKRDWSEHSIGTGNGVSTRFDIGSMHTTGLIVKLGTVVQTEGVHYTFGATAGTNGQDVINFASAPTTAHVINVSYNGKKYYPACIFVDDNMDYEAFNYAAYRFGITITEVTI